MTNALLYLFVFLGVQLLCLSGIPELWKLISGDRDTTVAMVTAAVAVYVAAVVALFALCRWFRFSRSFLRSRQWAALLWCGVAAAGAIVPAAALQEFLPETTLTPSGYMTSLMSSVPGFFLIAIAVPVAEEMVFRGAIQRKLAETFRVGWLSVAVAALLFAVVHINPAQMVHAFLSGLLLGWMYHRSGSIFPGLVYHWVNNSVAFVVVAAYGNPDITVSAIFGSSPRTLLVAVAFSLCIFVPAVWQVAQRLRKA